MVTPTERIRDQRTVIEYMSDLERAGHPSGLVIAAMFEAYLELNIIEEDDLVVDALVKVQKFIAKYTAKMKTRTYIS